MGHMRTRHLMEVGPNVIDTERSWFILKPDRPKTSTRWRSIDESPRHSADTPLRTPNSIEHGKIPAWPKKVVCSRSTTREVTNDTRVARKEHHWKTLCSTMHKRWKIGKMCKLRNLKEKYMEEAIGPYESKVPQPCAFVCVLHEVLIHQGKKPWSYLLDAKCWDMLMMKLKVCIDNDFIMWEWCNLVQKGANASPPPDALHDDIRLIEVVFKSLFLSKLQLRSHESLGICF